MRRSLFLGVFLFTMFAAAADADKSPRRLVLSIDGDWWDSTGQHLGFASALKGECVFGKRGSLQLADSTRKAALKFVYEEIAAQCSCERPNVVPEQLHCTKTDVPASPTYVEASAVSSNALSTLFGRLFRAPQLFIVAAARGVEEEPQEAVVPVRDSDVDLTAALLPVSPGAYVVTLENLDRKAVAGFTGRVTWKPGTPAVLPVSRIKAGLYRLNLAVEGGESEGSDAWVYLSGGDHYQKDAKDFQQVSELMKSWGDQVDASGKRALLRAELQSLAERAAGK